ncbi:MAG: hypothetical protein SFW35_00850 [Chitinophagales bacterium]|nr:hypothetical protein [Chitinophagales bacterium]
MATIQQLIDELAQIAALQPDLETFLYADAADINTQRDKQYPLLLAERTVAIENLNLKNRQRVYTLKLHFYDQYDRVTLASTGNELKQYDIESIAEDFLQRFRERYRAAGKPWKLENEDALNGQWAFNKHFDKLIELTYTLKVRSQGEC